MTQKDIGRGQAALLTHIVRAAEGHSGGLDCQKTSSDLEMKTAGILEKWLCFLVSSLCRGKN